MPQKRTNNWDAIKSSMLSQKDTLHNLSYDDANNAYMTDSTIRALHFDGIKDRFVQAFGVQPQGFHSVDAVLQSKAGNTTYFIEFKNGNFEIGQDVAPKIPDSIILYADIKDSKIEDIRTHCELILVYNIDSKPLSDSESRDLKSRLHLYKKAEREMVRFDLRRYKGTYFRDVHTYDEDQFAEFLKKKAGDF